MTILDKFDKRVNKNIIKEVLQKEAMIRRNLDRMIQINSRIILLVSKVLQQDIKNSTQKRKFLFVSSVEVKGMK